MKEPMRRVHGWNYSSPSLDDVARVAWSADARARARRPLGRVAARAAARVAVLVAARVAVLGAILGGVLVAAAGCTDAEAARRGAHTIVLHDASRAFALGDGAEFLIDDTGQLEVEAARRDPRWQPVDDERRTWRLGTGVLWLRATVREELPPPSSTSAGHPPWRIEFSHPRPVELTAWVPERGVLREKHDGLVTPLADREVVSRSVVVTFEPRPHVDETLLFRLQTSPLGFSADIVSPEQSARREASAHWVLGLYYGLASGLLIYNLFLFLSLRDRAYAWYVLVVFATMSFFWGRNGYFWMNGWTANSGSNSGPGITIQVIAIVQFTRALLSTRAEAPAFDRWLVRGAWLLVPFGVASALFPQTIREPQVGPFAVAVIAAALAMGVVRLRQGSDLARYFLLAWAAYLLGSLLYVLKSTGLVPHTVVTEHALQVGSTVEMSLLSFALAHRVRTAERRAREQEHAHAVARLEHDRALAAVRAAAAARLVEAQDEHSRRLARDLHDSVGHRFVLIERTVSDAREGDGEALDAIEALAAEGVAETREIAHGLYPQRLVDVGLAGALQAAVDAVARTGIAVGVDVDAAAADLLSAPRRLAALRIAEEAMHNALRHAAARTLTVALRRVDEAAGPGVELIVDDDGRGFAADVAATGLGLRTMADRAAQVGGDVVVQPRPGGGTRVRLGLPALLTDLP
jgi:signal transduction histidine kinase